MDCNLVALHIRNDTILAQGNNKNIEPLLGRLGVQGSTLRQGSVLAQVLVQLLACCLRCLLQLLGIVIGLHGAQLLQHGLGLTPAATINLVRLLLGLAQHVVLAPFELRLGVSQRVAQLLAFLAQRFDFCTAAFITTTLAIQLLQHIFHVHMLLIQ